MEPVAVDGLVGVYDDVVAFADADEEPVCCVGDDGHEVHGDDGHVVFVKTDLEVVVRAGVDETESVLLSLLHRVAIVSSATLSVDVGAIDEDIVGCRIALDEGT